MNYRDGDVRGDAYISISHFVRIRRFIAIILVVFFLYSFHDLGFRTVLCTVDEYATVIVLKRRELCVFFCFCFVLVIINNKGAARTDDRDCRAARGKRPRKRDTQTLGTIELLS